MKMKIKASEANFGRLYDANNELIELCLEADLDSGVCQIFVGCEHGEILRKEVQRPAPLRYIPSKQDFVQTEEETKDTNHKCL